MEGLTTNVVMPLSAKTIDVTKRKNVVTVAAGVRLTDSTSQSPPLRGLFYFKGRRRRPLKSSLATSLHITRYYS